MLAHCPCYSASGCRSAGHIPAVADVTSAATLVRPDVVSAKDDSVLFGNERFFVRSHPIVQRIGLAHITIHSVRRPVLDNRQDDLEDGTFIALSCSAYLHAQSRRVRWTNKLPRTEVNH